MNIYFKLENKKVVPATREEFVKFFQDNKERTVGRTQVGKILVSTVFLGLDHGFGGKPLYFETMLFDHGLDEYQERYSTWEEAEEGHERAVRFAEELGKKAR